MSAAHFCDECKRVAPLDENLGWWNVDAASTLAGQLLTVIEKPAYNFRDYVPDAGFGYARAAWQDQASEAERHSRQVRL